MKKLFSLILVALISSQMWAAINIKCYTNLNTSSTSGNTSCGELTGKYGTTSLFSSKSGSYTYDAKNYKGKQVVITATAKTGYYFYQWNNVFTAAAAGLTATTGTTSGNTATITVGDIACEVHAIFKQCAKATFYYQSKSYGYSSSKQDVYVIPGQTPAYSGSTPTKDEDDQYTYTFKGWSTSSSDPTGSVTALGPINSNTTYYARFTATPKAVKYTVSFAKNNNDWGTLSASQIANVPSDAEITVSNNQVTINGTTITATPAQATAEYTYAFSSWSNTTGTITAARTITANFSRTPKNYTLTWDVNGGNALTGSYTSGSVAFGTSITKPANPTRDGYVFNGWGATVAST